jgi:5-methylcytosine-specific restriction enzyme subunit McrC
MAGGSNIIILKEFERLPVGAEWDANKRIIGVWEAAAIERFQIEDGQELLQFGHRTIQATNWVGTLGIGRRCLEVLPKIDDLSGSLDARGTRENLLWMVARAGLVPIAPADIARLAESKHPLLAAFLQLYVENLALEWQRGPIKVYVAEEENRTFLSGKLLFQQQTRHNLIQQQRFYTVADEFTMNNPLSCLLKAALKRCALQRLSETVARGARGLLQEFADVSDWEISPMEAEQIKVSRQHSRFALLIDLAKLILQAISPEAGGEGQQVYSLMFDMNVVFERFVAAEMQVALAGFSLTVVPQLGGRCLLTQKGKKRFNLRPDIGISQGDKVICLIDTKWKRLDLNKPHAGVSQADVYQMYAYGKEYDSPLTVLLYPRQGRLQESIAEYLHNPEIEGETSPRTITVKTLDVCKPMGLPATRQELRECLMRCVKIKSLPYISTVK